ncbi:glycine--tRNA ligase beta subunit [Marinobacterium nitratireducens]|uniref:Glycine--tRNA ligase beta subunit n=1 Tax=Marinobacterium nitratireducens TaxID=518897 RepID=A0A918DQJ1_9GAMM|nr:glycine--tRNA ligase subunit beta [Marinobacterium nitratireducens]GGO77417.1 glycine--tRNA ligase beta subunit [Marinobacterium nitratireducens]
MAKDFLFELGTEELPPKALLSLSNALESEIRSGIEAVLGQQAETLLAPARFRAFAAPRRLAVLIENLATEIPASLFFVQGPPARIAFDADGKPSKALEGFARKCGTSTDALEEIDGKMCFRQESAAKPLADELPAIIQNALDKLPIPKRMRWGASRTEFVRPVKWACMLLGDEVIAGTIAGVGTGRKTRGHRFHYNHDIELIAPTDYERVLRDNGHVIADFAERRELIRSQLLAEAEKVGGEVVIDPALLDEVTALNEWPVALTGRFEERFLEVPAQALISTMADNQKYFHLLDGQGRLMPYFITVANIASKEPQQIIDGNEKVIRPRLADAAFFFETDKKTTLEARTEKLKAIVFQKDLGSVHDKTERVAKLATAIAERIGGSPAWAGRAALLSKSDLVTEMVLEFPELQGLMGYHYALNDGEPEEVARAQDEQYMPRFAGDRLPETQTGAAVAIADRLDTLVGLFGIDQPPTGSKDPFALRRATLGVLRIIVEKELNLDLEELLRIAADNHSQLSAREGVEGRVLDFMLERFRAWYEGAGIPVETFLSVQALRPTRPLDFDRRVRAVAHFRTLPEADALAAGNKRVSNILGKQAAAAGSSLDESLLHEDAEKALAERVKALQVELEPAFGRGDYQFALEKLASLRQVVDRFFDEVMVMADDEAVRNNRITLLSQLRALFLGVADISLLGGS